MKKREHRLFIRVTDEERNRILDKMYGMGIRSLSAYIFLSVFMCQAHNALILSRTSRLRY